MTIQYLGGRRISGLSSDSVNLTSFNTSTESGFSTSTNSITKDSGAVLGEIQRFNQLYLLQLAHLLQ